MSILDFLFPRQCLICGKKGIYFCKNCRSKIQSLEQQIYFSQPSLDILFCIFPYKGVIRKAILRLKYNFVTDLADELIDLSVCLLKPDLFDTSKKLILAPVPLHWYRKNWRGFNQTELLGEKIARKLKMKFSPDLLIRTRQTRPQTKLKEKERKVNVCGAFSVNKNSKFKIRNSKILLFDDVWTTGATMQECAEVLKRAGAKKVFGLTLAR